MSKLPKQIRKQVAAAERFGKKLQVAQQPVEDGKTAQADALLASIGDDAPVVETPVETPVETLIETPAPVETPAEPVIDYKQKYLVLQGKYDVEVPRLHEQNRTLQEQNVAREDAIIRHTAPAQTLVTEDDLEEYGPEFFDAVGRKAQEIAGQEIAGLRAELGDIKTQLNDTGQTIQSHEHERIFSVLDREIEDWRTTNKDPHYLAWLGQNDPYSGNSRKAMLLQAFDSGDVGRIKAFFEGFKQEHATVGPTSRTDDASSTLNLEGLVAPGESKSGRTQSTPSKKIWTNREITGFYAQVRKGAYKGKDADKNRIERDIVAAGREGRVR